MSLTLPSAAANTFLRHPVTGDRLRPKCACALFEVAAVALLAHTNCGMVNLSSKREQFIAGLIDKAGWDREWAEAHFMHFAPMFEIGNEVDFVLSEAKRLRLRYPKLLVAPLLYRVEDGQLYQLREGTL